MAYKRALPTEKHELALFSKGVSIADANVGPCSSQTKHPSCLLKTQRELWEESVSPVQCSGREEVQSSRWGRVSGIRYKTMQNADLNQESV